MEERENNTCTTQLIDCNEKEKNKKGKAKQATQRIAVKASAANSATANNGGDVSAVRIALFDFSVENFFRDMDTIVRLYGKEEGGAAIEQSEIQRMSSSVTFLREWRDFKYPSKNIKFTYGIEDTDCFEGKDVSAINLPPFSSASVPKQDMQKDQLGEVISQECKDFVMNVGGSVWALDWCPQVHEKPDSSIKCEFIAVAAHPPGSSYHKMGAPLTGRGVIQIWCLLNIWEHNDKSTERKKPKGRPRKNPTEDMSCDKTDGDTTDKSTQIKKPRGRPRKNPIVIAVDDMSCDKKDGGANDKSTLIKRPRGRPRKNPTVTAVDDANCEIQDMPPLVQFPENSTEFPTPEGNHEKNEEILPKTDGGTNDKLTQIKKFRGTPGKNSIVIAVDDMNCETQNKSACDVQVAQNSTEFLASDGKNNEKLLITYRRKNRAKENEETDEKSALIKSLRRKPKSNSKGVTADDPHCYNKSLDIQNAEVSTEYLSPDMTLDDCNEKSVQRPRKRHESNSTMTNDPNCENESMPLDIQVLEDSAEFLSLDDAHDNCNKHALQQCSVTKEAVSACNTFSTTVVKSDGLKINHREGRYDQDISQPLQYDNQANYQLCSTSELEAPPTTSSIPEDVTLPRVVSCLAHNGKVAWDVKWRPTNISDSSYKHRMGYLAVLLGNGSLEVWEVPLPHVVRAIYMHREGTDPRFIKLEPVFRCSMLKRRGIQSIPLTVEWSVTPPHDYLLAGCHDGTVALWKFCINSSSKCDDTMPLLCFGGDTVPIRTVAWAPFEGDPESSNIIVTAGHEGLKFWDLRNPFRPLRSLHPAPRIIYSLDWLSKPSCIIMSFEDGTIRTISLAKAANDLPVTGEIYSGKKQPGLHGSLYASFAIWSVQVSRITGMLAFCGADGTVFRFQLTTKSVETDHARNRARRFLCGSVTEENSNLVINTPVSNAPFLCKKLPVKGRCAESFRDLLSKTNPYKNALNKVPETSSFDFDSQTLAIGADENVDLLESGSEEALYSMKQPKRTKLNNGSKKKPEENLDVVCKDGDVPLITTEADNEKSDFGNIPETFPPKMAALHKVRWNMNKGSEKWLCFGGACGLVRCQEIVYSDIDKKWALKK
ncbi:hypothetical protein PHAVU_007G229800 [Phaseolus vulgaris]|uniref:Uncharacterized protein n=2 Tax=Phaseolus vulgaris TaxID=3885 RepID=V7BHK5_PHAVU|nr:hypothetical protein PHAVU_007G229800g [Phaseolus vulgaris]ESW17322.1 hypothetical protein PHAVU_007G229800g [Phaseolus vulgaris]